MEESRLLAQSAFPDKTKVLLYDVFSFATKSATNFGKIIKDGHLPTPVPGAFRCPWTFPRPKNMPLACFLNGLSSPSAAKKSNSKSCWTFLAGAQGLEP